MDLTSEEIRVLGALIEKERTTPDQYPLTTNALKLACNQKTSRDPIVDFDERTVDQAMLALRDRRLARTVVGGTRASKHKQVADETWGFGPDALAVLSVLALRGPQTPGELRSRTERLFQFASPEDVVVVLDQLAAHNEPLVTMLERRPGQKEARYAHLLSGEVIDFEPSGPYRESSGASNGAARSAVASRVEELEEEVRSLSSDVELLRTQFDALCERLGETL